ncbi:MAG: class I SAM-dependent methyltransferase [Bacteroidales bacterium]|nr:class I SAM-dependent methyltransferase [Bacteroidales bacterium]
MMLKNDPFGAALLDYFNCRLRLSKIQVFCDVSGDEIIRPAYLFRGHKKMPALEKQALQMCRGKVLDVGACAGSHSLYLQQNGFDVTALDISEGCCSVMEKRGIEKVVCTNFFDYSGETFDTILFLMNGIGICGTIDRMPFLLGHCRKLLNPGGQIIFDSSDIDYIYYEKDGSKWINLNSNYYGEVNYKLHYKKVTGKTFSWVFVDAETMKKNAEEAQFSFNKIADGPHYDYLGVLNPK